MRSRTLSAILAAAAVGTFVACVGPGITDTVRRDPAVALQEATATLIECPTDETTTASALVTAAGSIVSLDGTSISIPAGALLSSATVTVTIPASRYMEVDISVDGAEHFLFELPVTITIGYARCDRSDIDESPLSAWYIDSETKALLELMGGIDDKLLRTVTFLTDHLSGYAVAN